MKPEQEPKYSANAKGQLFNRETGSIIPDDEPVFILRARDRNAIKTLLYYAMLCKIDGHQREALNRVVDFNRFANDKPECIREPGEFRVSSAPKQAAAPAVKPMTFTMHSNIYAMGLPLRIINPLHENGGIFTILDLISTTKAELELIKGVGKKAVIEIIEKLAAHGLELKPVITAKGADNA